MAWLLACALCIPAVWGQPARETVLVDFESATYGSWEVEGEAFGKGPARGALPDQMGVGGFVGKGLANSYHGGDKTTGTLTSPEFIVQANTLSFLIGGGRSEEVGAELLVGGRRVRLATGDESETLGWKAWDVRDLRGQAVRVRLFDRATGGWGHILFDQLTQGDEPRAEPIPYTAEEYRRSAKYYRERYRPQFHFTPEINWMNDPNGMVYFEGEYHLFYQYNPFGNSWGHMSWGHAVSKDLANWEHLPLALAEENDVMIFSGSAVVDWKNTSGLGKDGKPPLIAIYTGHHTKKPLQNQQIAYSNDRGRTWTKYAGNPVLDIGEKDFRDPKVFWHEATGKWVMVVSMAEQKRIRFYGSPNLKEWKLLSEFGPAGVPNKANWECPDLFELPIRGEKGATRWVLEADMGNGSIAGGSGGEYFTGQFDGTTFVADSKDSQWVDYGRDFYAPVSWSDIPKADGRRIWIGWMNNWETCLNPTSPWRSAMSVPRSLELARINGKLRMVQAPVKELQQLRGEPIRQTDKSLANQAVSLPVRGQQMELELELDPGTATEVGVRVLKGKDEETSIIYRPAEKAVRVDRTRSGNVRFDHRFSGAYSAPLSGTATGTIKLRVLVDCSSVEVFGNQGETVLTNLVYPKPDSDGVELFASGGTARVVSCVAWPLRSIWTRQAAK